MFGSHLSIAGGLHKALLEAERLGFGTVQVFTKNQQQWVCRALEEEAVGAWEVERKRLGFDHVVSHDSYLINLASQDEELWKKSVEMFAEEIRRCEVLKIPYLVAHPGAHMGAGEMAGLKRVAEGVDRARELVAGEGVTTCLEITAGQGSSLGYRLEHLAEIISQVKRPEGVGICLDTAHLFAAGYDFRGEEGYAEFMEKVDSIVGVERLKVWHLNDSKKELGSRVDRHEHIGQGFIGAEAFGAIVRDERFANVPKILETPKGKREDGREWDEVNLERLREVGNRR